MADKLAFRNVTKTYKNAGSEETGRRIMALDHISLSVKEGEFVSLIGPSGCGKSTLLDLAAGLAVPDDGEILLDGHSIIGKKGNASYMPQNDALFPWRTILDNVIVPLQVQGIDKKIALEEARNLLAVFGLKEFAESYPSMLSGGMRQRAAFLRTFLGRKQVMLLDEPFASLDALTRLEIQQWLMEMWQHFRHSVLLVTHSMDEAVLLSDRVYVMSARPGRILAEVHINLPRPRTGDLSLHPSFIQAKQELFAWLSSGMSPTKAGEGK